MGNQMNKKEIEPRIYKGILLEDSTNLKTLTPLLFLLHNLEI